VRCFVAIALDEAWRDALSAVLRKQSPATRDVRWCTPDQLHVTLKFLGQVPPDRLEDVKQAIRTASEGVAPFTLRRAAIGAFPSRSSPRVLWCGVEDPDDGCAAWVARAEPLFEQIGYPRENRPYHAHITLARSRSPAGSRELRNTAEQIAIADVPDLHVTQVVLYESKLQRGGAVYTPLGHFPLGS
jgi:2'-5' RNA ligase